LSSSTSSSDAQLAIHPAVSCPDPRSSGLLSADATPDQPAPARVTLAATLALTAAPADAKKRYARRTGQDCAHCHNNPQGGGPRNTVGLYYQAHRALPPAEMGPGDLQAAVDRYLDEVGRAVPDVIWRYTPVEALPDRPLPALTPADDLTVLRRLALDLTTALPGHAEIRALETGEATLADQIERYLASADFEYTFRLYHRDLIRPRSGIFNQTPALTQIRRLALDDRTVYSSVRLPAEANSARLRARQHRRGRALLGPQSPPRRLPPHRRRAPRSRRRPLRHRRGSGHRPLRLRPAPRLLLARRRPRPRQAIDGRRSRPARDARRARRPPLRRDPHG
jgi:hypothetical protein